MSKTADPAPETEQAGAPSPAPVQGVTVAQLVAPLPEVNEAAITAEREDQEQDKAEQEQEQEQGKPGTSKKIATPAAPSQPLPASKPDSASKPAPTDSKGRTFDQRIHETTPDGRPIFCKDSPYLKQRRHALPGWKAASVVNDPPPPASDAAQPEAQGAPTAAQLASAQLATAQTFAGLQLLIMRRAFGESIAKKDAEAASLVDSWSAVLEYYGMGAMHPLLGLAMLSGSLVLVNVNEPDTRSKLAKLRDWFERLALGFWQRLRRRFGWGAKPVHAEPHPEPTPAPAPAKPVADETAEAVEHAGVNGRRL